MRHGKHQWPPCLSSSILSQDGHALTIWFATEFASSWIFFFLVQIRNVLNRLYVSEHFVPNYPHCLGRIVEPRGNAGGREEGRLWCRTAWPHFLSTRFLAFWHGVLKSTSCTLGHAFSAIMDSMHLNGKPKETRSPLSCFSHDILSRNWHELWVIKKAIQFRP